MGMATMDYTTGKTNSWCLPSTSDIASINSINGGTDRPSKCNVESPHITVARSAGRPNCSYSASPIQNSYCPGSDESDGTVWMFLPEIAGSFAYTPVN